MNKIAKAILITIASSFGVLLLIVVGAHLYVESASVQSRIEAAVSQQVKMPVKVSLLRFSLWSGLRVEGLVIGEDEEKPFARVPEITARVAWKPLILSRRLVVRELRIAAPEVVWQQDSKGKWSLPTIEKEKDAAPVKADAAAKATAAREPKEKAPVEKETAGKKAERQRVEFRIVQARINGGSFRFLDRKGKTLAELAGVNVSIPVLAPHEAHGEVAIQRLFLRKKLEIEAIRTAFDYQEGTLVFPELTANVAGGQIKGTGTLRPETEDAPFSTKTSFTNIDLGRLLTDLEASGFTRGQGKLHGSLEMSGETANPKSFVGKGEARLEGGRMEQYPLLQMLGQTLRIDELTQLELDQARLITEIRKSRVYVKDLTLESTNLTLSATGQVRFDQKMNLDANLAMNEKITRQLPSWVRSNFRPADGSDRVALPFKVTGTLEDPDTDLVKALMGEQLERQANSLFRAIKQLTGSGDKEKKKKDKKQKK